MSTITDSKTLVYRLAYLSALAMIFTLPWENIRVTANLGTIGRVAGVVMAGFWAMFLITSGRIRTPRPFHIIFALYVFLHISSFYWSIDPNRTLGRLQTYVQLLIMAYVLWNLLTTKEAMRSALQAYVFGAFVAIDKLLDNYFAGVTRYTGRYVADGFDPNNLGVILALGIPMAAYLATTFDEQNRLSRVLRIVNYAYIPLALMSILLTASRGALITTIPALFFVVWALFRIPFAKRFVVFIALIGALMYIQPLIPQASLDRLSSTDDQIQSGDLNGRVDIWVKGFDTFKESPFLGIGSFAFASSGDAAHNSFLAIITETGIVGFTLFTLITINAFLEARRQPKWEARFWTTMLIVLFLGAFSLNWAHRKQAWLIPMMISISAGVYVTNTDKEESSSDELLGHPDNSKPSSSMWPYPSTDIDYNG